MRTFLSPWLCALAAVVPVLAHAAGPVKDSGARPLESTLAVYQVARGADGKESFSPAASVAPGQLLEYRLTYRNHGKSGVKDLLAVLPVPAGVAFEGESAKPSALHASLDGKTFAPVPLKRKVTRADGRIEEVLVPTTEYRSLRWALGDLAGLAQVTASARARVNPIQIAEVTK